MPCCDLKRHITSGGHACGCKAVTALTVIQLGFCLSDSGILLHQALYWSPSNLTVGFLHQHGLVVSKFHKTSSSSAGACLKTSLDGAVSTSLGMWYGWWTDVSSGKPPAWHVAQATSLTLGVMTT